MKTAMISQPMAGKSDSEIESSRKRAAFKLRKDLGYRVLKTRFTSDFFSYDSMKSRGIVNNDIYFLAKSLEAMSRCNAVYFCKGWDDARGCKIEHAVAKAYGLKIIYE